MLSFALFCVLSFAVVADVHGQVVISGIHWRVLPPKQSGRKAETVVQVVRPPQSSTGDPIGAVVTIREAGPKKVVGVLLRYAVSAKIAPIQGNVLRTGTWTVPFWIEEVRVPQLKAGKEKEITIRNLNMEPTFKHLRREGFWPVAFKIQIMVEPKKGEDLAGKMLEAELPVLWGK